MTNQPKKQGSKMWVFLIVIGTLVGMSALKLAYDLGLTSGLDEAIVSLTDSNETIALCLKTNDELLRQVDELLDASFVVTSELENLTSDFILMYETNKEREIEQARQAYNLSAEYVACQSDKQYLEVLALDRLLEIQELKEQ